ncbi:MAG: molybdenum cofactor biosynthesis protein MoaE [Enterobacterales bacterium]|nr:molybdenum cofactor biosynthesis protein MoaE [Enterobacterales bacterium]
MKQTEIHLNPVYLAITDKALDLAHFNRMVQQQQGEYGASVIFTGSVRVSSAEKHLVAMSLEHYPGMTETLLQQIIDKAVKRWQLGRVVVVHRVGYLKPGEPIVFVATAALHRREAFEAAEYIMDYLKTDATFWKQEHYRINGVTKDVWVEAKQSDQQRLKRWQQKD